MGLMKRIKSYFRKSDVEESIQEEVQVKPIVKDTSRYVSPEEIEVDEVTEKEIMTESGYVKINGKWIEESKAPENISPLKQEIVNQVYVPVAQKIEEVRGVVREYLDSIKVVGEGKIRRNERCWKNVKEYFDSGQINLMDRGVYNKVPAYQILNLAENMFIEDELFGRELIGPERLENRKLPEGFRKWYETQETEQNLTPLSEMVAKAIY